MDTAAALKALADDNRLLILRLLSRRDYCVRALARQIGISEAAVSQHLKVLREAGLVSGERRGYFIHYQVEREPLLALSRTLSVLAQGVPAPCSPAHGGCGPEERRGCRMARDWPGPSFRPDTANWEETNMKIAVTYENGQVFQHFGHCEQFKLYTVEAGAVSSSQVVGAAGSGHGALAGFLRDLGADTLICGGIGGGARTALAQAGIRLFPGVIGDADQAVSALLAGRLEFDPDTVCSHHHEGEHNCHSHSCSQDKQGCGGNH